MRCMAEKPDLFSMVYTAKIDFIREMKICSLR